MQAVGSGSHTGQISVAGFPWRFGVDGEAEKGVCTSLESRQWQGLGWRLEPGVPLAQGGEREGGGLAVPPLERTSVPCSQKVPSLKPSSLAAETV